MPGYLALAAAAPEVNLFPDLPTVVWTIINFLVLFGAMYALLHKPLLKAVAAREEGIAAALDKAARDRDAAERARREFEEKLDQVHLEAGQIINKATKAAEAMRTQIIAEARAQAGELINETTAAIEQEKLRALSELRGEVADLALLVAGQVIEAKLDNADQRRLAEQFVERVGSQ